MLNIIKTIENEKALFALEGRLDTTTAPDLEKEVKESLDGVSDLTMDMKKLSYISSAGLRVLLSTHKMMAGRKGSLVITGTNEVVNEIFEVTGFSDILVIK